MNTAEYLNTLIECKEDMKAALIEKGAPPAGGLSTYADAIRSIGSFKINIAEGTKFGGATFGDMLNFDFSNVKDGSIMFRGFAGDTLILNDSLVVTNAKGMFYDCHSKNIPLLDFGNVTDFSIGVDGCYAVNYGGFYNFGKQKNCKCPIFNNPDITRESMINIFNNLYDRATAGYSVLTLKLNTNILALLSDEDIAIATNKGWTIE